MIPYSALKLGQHSWWDVIIKLVPAFPTKIKFSPGCQSQFQSRGCSERSCYPAMGNLLIGRADRLSATDTCGQERRVGFAIYHIFGGLKNYKRSLFPGEVLHLVQLESPLSSQQL